VRVHGRHLLYNKCMEKREIKLLSGATLEVATTPKFLDAVRKHYGLEESAHVSDDHIRYFIHGATVSAIEKEAAET